jgi:peptidyl-prolyl cis-trans isomerase B (cyclophilin B)
MGSQETQISEEENSDNSSGKASGQQDNQKPPSNSNDALNDPNMQNTVIGAIELESGGVIEFELYPDLAPQSVYNFAYLARQGYYDGLIFHRVIKDFMIQGGDPEGTGAGGPGYCIKGEFEENGVSNNLAHDRGVISMARKGFPLDSAGSQFFIVHKNSNFLDGAYAAFGRVTKGLDYVDEIAECKTQDDRPLKDVVIKTITIEGPELPEPERLPSV